MPLAVALVVGVHATASAQGVFFSLSGDFQNATDAVQFPMELSASVSSADTFEFETFSHSGGLSWGLGLINNGGFDPILELFDGMTSLGLNDDGDPGPVVPFNRDALLSWQGVATNPLPANGYLNTDPIPIGSYHLDLTAYQPSYPGGASHWALDMLVPADRVTLAVPTLVGGATLGDLSFGTTGLGPSAAKVVVPAGQTLTLTGTLTMGSNDKATLTCQGTINSGPALIMGSTVTATVSGSGLWAIAGDAQIGNGGEGNLIVETGGTVTVTGNMDLGAAAFSTGNLTVADPNSTLTVDEDLWVGTLGVGTMEVRNGGTVDSSGVGFSQDMIGSQSMDDGTVEVTDPGSRWRTDTLDVGQAGVGRLTVSNGGQVLTSGDAFIAKILSFSSGSFAHITGADSLWEVSDRLFVGGDDGTNGAGGTGTLTIDGGGLVEVAPGGVPNGQVKLYSTGTVNLNSGGTLDADRVELDPGAAFSTQAGSTLRVNQLIGFGNHPAFNGSLEFGTYNGPSNGLHVVGPGQTLSTNENLVIGHDWHATLEIGGGGAVDTLHDGFIGRFANSDGSRVHVGAGSVWNVGNVLWVGGGTNVDGPGATAELVVEAGANVNTGFDIKVWDPGAVILDGGQVSPANNLNLIGTLTGNGTVDSDANNKGVVAPGLSAGEIVVTGDYTQSPTGTLLIELGGLASITEYDRVDVGGAVTLAGVLDINLINAFVPGLGDAFTVLSYGSHSGQFSTINGQSAGPGRWFFLDYSPNDLTLIVANLLLGDANNDGQVTGADLIAVQQNFGNVGAADGLLFGDANDDGQVTGADLISVQQNFGNVVAPAGATVPEPAIAILLGMSGLPLMLRRRVA